MVHRRSWWEHDYQCDRSVNINIPMKPPCLPENSSDQMNCTRERIISVQEQRQNQGEVLFQIRCKSKYTDKCYAEYNVNSLHRGYGQLKEVRLEKNELGKPSLVIHSSTLERSENQINELTNQSLNQLESLGIRKRFAIVHTEKYVYIIGGYLYDSETSTRQKPLHDYKYDIQTKKLIPVQALPNGALGFGLCADGEQIYAVGGNDINNQPLSDCYYLSVKQNPETWKKLPDLPAPTTGPGVGVHNGELHCIGGLDLLGNASIAHGEYLILRSIKDQQWRYASEISPSRARPLVVIVADKTSHKRTVYVAGGFNVHANARQAFIVPDIQCFDENKQRWRHLTTIPHLKLFHILSFSNNKLYVNQTIDPDDPVSDTKVIRHFDLTKLEWQEVDKVVSPLQPTSQSSPETVMLPVPKSNFTVTPKVSDIKQSSDGTKMATKNLTKSKIAPAKTTKVIK